MRSSLVAARPVLFTGALLTGALFTGALFTGALFTGALITGALFGVGSVAAQDAVAEAAGEDTADAQARRHYRLGTAHYENGAFAEAAAEFELAYGLSPRPELLYNIYVSYRDDGDLANSARALRLYLERNPDAENGEALRARLAALERQLAERPLAESGGATEPASPPASSAIASSPAGFVVGGVGLGFVVGAIVTGLLADDRRAALERTCGPSRDACPPGFESDQSTGQALAITTDVLGAVGGLAVAAGVVMIFAVDGREPPLTASCGPTGCSVFARGRF